MAPERLKVRAERMAPEGAAVARAAGSPRVLFVPYAVPGDELEVEVVEAKSSFARARILRVISPGPERVAPPCPLHYDPARAAAPCGGCDWQQLPYEAQLRHKREVVLDCLSRIGKIRDLEVSPTKASPRPWGYRNKVQIPFGREGGRVVAGFYAPHSHAIVDFDACPVQPDLSVRIALKVKELAAEWSWPTYDERAHRGWLRHLFVRTNDEGRALAALVTRGPDFPMRDKFVSRMREAFPELVGLHQNVQPLQTSVVLGPTWRRLWGEGRIDEKVGPFVFSVSPSAFLQVNTGAAAVLYGEAEAALREGGRAWPLALDLYCGAGTLTLWAARAASRVIGVEESRDAVRDAWENAKRNGVGNVRFVAGRVEAALPRLREQLPRGCAAVVDPPRAGLSQPALRFLTTPQVERLVYVSCNPATFARDAAYLAQSGFRLRRVQPVDLFPQTSHVELVGLLDRTRK